MKKILLFALVVLSSCLISARASGLKFELPDMVISIPDTLELYDTLGNMINNEAITVSSLDLNIEPLQAFIWVKNACETPMQNIFVRRTVNEEVSGSMNSFCFGINCYGPTTNESTVPVEIAAGVTDKSFYGDYTPNGNGGSTSITYEFFDNVTFGVPVSAKTTVIYKISAMGIDDNQLVFKGPFPNPASQNASFEYNIPSGYTHTKLIVRDMLGVEVISTQLDDKNGKKTIDVSNLASGIYFYTLKSGNKILLSKKLIVKH